jgi:hypothetical protein
MLPASYTIKKHSLVLRNHIWIYIQEGANEQKRAISLTFRTTATNVVEMLF